MKSILLEAREVSKTYVMRHKTVAVLRGADLRVAAGESVAVVGMSGSGKSTLLHILGGLGGPDQGRVMLGGEDVYALTEAQRARVRAGRIGFVFQAYHLMPEMTVLENVMLPAMVQRGFFRSRSRMRERAVELLEGVGLADRSGHTPMELSGGEQQRAALARALMNQPDLVLADEPTGNLDETTGTRVLDRLFAMTRDGGRTLVVVTHNRAIAAQCDRTVHLRDGVLQQGAGSGL